MSRSELLKGLETAINRCSAESGSGTPDFVLAEFLDGCLEAFERAMCRRDDWFGVRTSDASIRSAPVEPASNPTGGAVGVPEGAEGVRHNNDVAHASGTSGPRPLITKPPGPQTALLHSISAHLARLVELAESQVEALKPAEITFAGGWTAGLAAAEAIDKAASAEQTNDVEPDDSTEPLPEVVLQFLAAHVPEGGFRPRHWCWFLDLEPPDASSPGVGPFGSEKELHDYAKGLGITSYSVTKLGPVVPPVVAP